MWPRLVSPTETLDSLRSNLHPPRMNQPTPIALLASLAASLDACPRCAQYDHVEAPLNPHCIRCYISGLPILIATGGGVTTVIGSDGSAKLRVDAGCLPSLVKALQAGGALPATSGGIVLPCTLGGKWVPATISNHDGVTAIVVQGKPLFLDTRGLPTLIGALTMAIHAPHHLRAGDAPAMNLLEPGPMRTPGGRAYKDKELACVIKLCGRKQYTVNPGSNPSSTYMVDLEEFDGFGSCGCDNFLFDGSPHLEKNHGMGTTCKHINLVRMASDAGYEECVVYPDLIKL